MKVNRASASRSDGTGADPQLPWDAFVLPLIHPTKVIIVEAILWIGRPTSATELEKIASGEPELSHFSFHLKRLVAVGVLEVVAKLKARKSQSANMETFFYFVGQHQWALPIARLRDLADPLTKVASSLTTAQQPVHRRGP